MHVVSFVVVLALGPDTSKGAPGQTQEQGGLPSRPARRLALVWRGQRGAEEPQHRARQRQAARPGRGGRGGWGLGPLACGGRSQGRGGSGVPEVSRRGVPLPSRPVSESRPVQERCQAGAGPRGAPVRRGPLPTVGPGVYAPATKMGVRRFDHPPGRRAPPQRPRPAWPRWPGPTRPRSLGWTAARGGARRPALTGARPGVRALARPPFAALVPGEPLAGPPGAPRQRGRAGGWGVVSGRTGGVAVSTARRRTGTAGLAGQQAAQSLRSKPSLSFEPEGGGADHEPKSGSSHAGRRDATEVGEVVVERRTSAGPSRAARSVRARADSQSGGSSSTCFRVASDGAVPRESTPFSRNHQSDDRTTDPPAPRFAFFWVVVQLSERGHLCFFW